MLPVEIATLAFVNVAILVALGMAGIYFHSLGQTGRAIARMLFCACVELLLATVSLYFIDNVRLLAALRIIGRCVELGGVIQLLVHLFRRANGRDVHDTVTDGGG